MPVETLVSLDAYLNTSYQPDCDYIEGELGERNAGTFEHSRMQFLVVGALHEFEAKFGLVGLMEQRVQVSATRVRIPDLCVLGRNQPASDVIRTPPFLCIEILSPDDTMSAMQERIDDYLAFGVPHVWVIDPRRQRSYSVTTDGMVEMKDSILRTSDPEIAIAMSNLYLR